MVITAITCISDWEVNMPTYRSRADAERAAARGTADGSVHDVRQGRDGLGRRVYRAVDTGKSATPVERRRARRSS